MAGDLPPFPPQPAGVPWPADGWPAAPGDAPAALDREVAWAFSQEAGTAVGVMRALLVVRGGRIIAERYAEGLTPESTLPSWSMAKSVLHAIVGSLVAAGRLAVDTPAPVPRWRSGADARGAITLDHLLRMSDGLAFREDYVDGSVSDVIPMLFGPGQDDVAAFAESFPLLNPPGAVWNYSSGTSNIISGVVARTIGGGAAAYEAHMRAALFDRIGMRSAAPRFDAAGTWIGSSFVFATARDFARFGLLYLRGGAWDGAQLLPRAWVEYARTPAPACVTGEYGAHWWIYPERPAVFYASGYEGQRIVVAPEHDVVIVRSAKSEIAQRAAIQAHVLRALDAAAEAAPPLQSTSV